MFTVTVAVAYCSLVFGFGIGVAAGISIGRKDDRRERLSNSLAIADRNPEYVPRPPAEVERAIGLREFRRVQNAGRSGVPGRKA